MCTFLHIAFYPFVAWSQNMMKPDETDCQNDDPPDVKYVVMIYSANWEQAFSLS